jgi:hypothetical protein
MTKFLAGTQVTAPFLWDMTPRRLIIETRRFEVLSQRQEPITQWRGVIFLRNSQCLQPHHREILKNRKNMMTSAVVSMGYFIYCSVRKLTVAYQEGMLWVGECSSPIAMGLNGQIPSSNASHKGGECSWYRMTLSVFWPQTVKTSCVWRDSNHNFSIV